MGRELGQRLAVAGVGVPLCVAVTWLGGLPFVAGIALLAGVSAREYVLLFRRIDRCRPMLVPTMVGAAAFPFLVHWQGTGAAWGFGAFYLMAIAAWALARRPVDDGPLASAALTAFGALYLGGLLGFAVPVRAGGEGRLAGTLLFFLPVTVTWVADTAAYFGGRQFGRHSLAPRVSPNKTWAGAVSALVAGPAAAALYAAVLLPLAGAAYPALPGDALPVGPALLLGLVVAGGAIVGDLVESALKRECGAKDSSNLLPGHGGLLDRLDSLLWAIPVAYLFLSVHGATS